MAKKPGAYNGYSDARRAANARYEAASVERISLVLPKGQKSVIQAHAKARGESVNGFLKRAIIETISRDNSLKTSS